MVYPSPLAIYIFYTRSKVYISPVNFCFTFYFYFQGFSLLEAAQRD